MHDPRALLLPLQIIDESQMCPDLDAAIRPLLYECFPADANKFSICRAWNEVWPAFTVLVRQDDRVVGHVGIITRRITCGGELILIAGVQSLAVAVDWRRTGLSQRLMTVAMGEARRRGIRFGLLFCVPQLERLYAGLAWRLTERAVTMRDAAGQSVPLTAKNICMDLALDGELLPPGPIDLEGRDW